MIEREEELEKWDRTTNGILQRKSVKCEEERRQREENWMAKWREWKRGKKGEDWSGENEFGGANWGRMKYSEERY